MNTHTQTHMPAAVAETGGGFTGWVDDLTSRLGGLAGVDPVSVALLAACAAMTAVLVVLVVRTPHGRPQPDRSTADRCAVGRGSAA